MGEGILLPQARHLHPLFSRHGAGGFTWSLLLVPWAQERRHIPFHATDGWEELRPCGASSTRLTLLPQARETALPTWPPPVKVIGRKGITATEAEGIGVVQTLRGQEHQAEDGAGSSGVAGSCCWWAGGLQGSCSWGPAPPPGSPTLLCSAPAVALLFCLPLSCLRLLLLD